MRLARLEALLCDAARNKGGGIPEAGRALWDIFVQLNATRPAGGFGPGPISYAEVEAFARLNRWPLQPHHVRMIIAMDRALLSSIRIGAGARDRRPSAELTAAAFDAVF